MSVTAAKGFIASGIACGIRRTSADLAVVRSSEPSTGGAMFTRNRAQAPPLKVCQSHLAVAEPQAVVINSGIANAATGQRGLIDATATAAEAGRLLGLSADEVLVLSTGVIGVPLPLGKIRAGLVKAVADLDTDGGTDAAKAIMTTDTKPKEAAAEGPGFTVGGMAKGSGMIHPALATMLSVITTDYPLRPGEAIEFLRPAVESTFNRISIDGECSTNDAVILLANGVSHAPRDDEAFAAKLREVCADLARQVVADGEGVSVILEIEVNGAASDDDAVAIAQRIATSPLVKTAAFGHDANWGRVLVAAGSATLNGGFAALDPERLKLSFNGTEVFANGLPSGDQPSLDGPALRIDLDLGLGTGQASYLATDLTYDYVKINAEYTT